MSESNHRDTNRTNLGLRLLVGDLRAQGAKALGSSLADALRTAVRDGRLPAGSPLPATRGLADDLGVSRGVVVRAYEQLVAEGYLRSHRGRGTVVGEVHAAAGTAAPSTDLVLPASPGLPALGTFPRREWLRAMETALAELPDADLGYGDPRGHPRLRRALAAYLGRTRAVVAPVDQIVVTAGFAQAIRLVAESLARHGIEIVGTEDPGSSGVATAVRAAGVDTRPVRVDEHGLDVGALRDCGVEAVCVTPAHQFPTGVVLAPSRRAELLEWAMDGGVVIEDDYDAEYRYDRSPVGALQGLAPDRVVYGGSVSKSLAPGVRLGWVVAPAWLAGTIADAKLWADISTPVLDQVTLAVFIENGSLDRHVRRTGAHYGRTRECLLTAVEQHLPGWTVTGVAAGLHAVLVPPTPVPDDVLRRAVGAAVAAGLGVVPLDSHVDGDERAGVVVGYGAATPDVLDRGVRSLATEVASGPQAAARSAR